MVQFRENATEKNNSIVFISDTENNAGVALLVIASDSISKDPRFEPRQVHKKIITRIE